MVFMLFLNLRKVTVSAIFVCRFFVSSVEQKLQREFKYRWMEMHRLSPFLSEAVLGQTYWENSNISEAEILKSHEQQKPTNKAHFGNKKKLYFFPL